MPQTRGEGGGQTPAELDYMSLMRGDRRHSLPPTYLSLQTHTHTHATFLGIHLASITEFILYYSKTPLQRFKRVNPQLPTEPMYYSNDSQGTLSIIYVDFLIRVEEKGKPEGTRVSFTVNDPKFQQDVILWMQVF